MTDIIEPESSIYEPISDTLESHPDEVAFTEVHPDPTILPDGKGAESITFGELEDRANRIANKLDAVGVREGDVVSYQLPNWVEFPLVYLGVQKAGGVSNPILTEHRAYEVGFMVDLCESDVVVIPSTFRGFDHVAMLEGMIDDGDVDPEHVVVVGDFESEDDRFHEFSWLEDAPSTPVDCPHELDDLEELVFTSGTTGEPKGVRQTARVGFHQTMQPTDYLGLEASDVLFAASPLGHNTGYHYLLRLGLVVGAEVVLFDKWDPARAVETIEEYDCTFSVGATTFLKDLLDLPDIDDYDLSSLRLFPLGGSTIPRPVVEEAYELFDDITIMSLWGQTENGIVTASAHDDPIEKISTTDGKPLPGCEVTVRETYDGPEIRNEPGKLLMRGKPLTDGYHRRPEITAESFTEDGWFKTGDLAILYDDGYISIEGREKDIIIRGGENISAPEVEEHLLEHPAVQEVALVAMPDDRLQERPCAYIRVAPGHDRSEATVESLSAFLDDRGVQKHKHPERVEIIGEFPRTSTGKIQKFELREEIAEKVGDERQ